MPWEFLRPQHCFWKRFGGYWRSQKFDMLICYCIFSCHSTDGIKMHSLPRDCTDVVCSFLYVPEVCVLRRCSRAIRDLAAHSFTTPRKVRHRPDIDVPVDEWLVKLANANVNVSSMDAVRSVCVRVLEGLSQTLTFCRILQPFLWGSFFTYHTSLASTSSTMQIDSKSIEEHKLTNKLKVAAVRLSWLVGFAEREWRT